MIFSEKLYDVGHKLKLNRQFWVYAKNDGEYQMDYAESFPKNYGHGFDVPFYIGLTYSNNDEHGNHQWKWSSTGRMISKDTLGERGDWEGKWKSVWKFISWAKGANGKKLRGNCTFVTFEAELWEIKCSTKLTIVCEESFS